MTRAIKTSLDISGGLSVAGVPVLSGMLRTTDPTVVNGSLWIDEDEIGLPVTGGVQTGPLDTATADARYVNVTGDTMTGPLTVEADTTGRHLELRTTNNDYLAVGLRANGRPSGDQSYVYGIEAEGRFYIRPSADGFGWQTAGLYIQRDGSLLIPSPTGAPADANHVPRLARTPNSVTGDLGLPGFAGSDTGWRNITASLVNGWAATAVYARRVAGVVYYYFDQLDPTSKTSDNALSPLPTGFRESSFPQRGTLNSTNNPPAFARTYHQTAISVLNATTVVYGLLTIPTSDPWPTSLPGTEITPPASWS